jgi:hypothetical protein
MKIKDTIHPHRRVMSDSDLAEVLEGIAADENWMSLDEIEAVADILYDRIVAKAQTHEGSLAIN